MSRITPYMYRKGQISSDIIRLGVVDVSAVTLLKSSTSEKVLRIVACDILNRCSGVGLGEAILHTATS